MNGIGPLVSQWVHQRNAAHHHHGHHATSTDSTGATLPVVTTPAEPTAGATNPTTPIVAAPTTGTDSAQFSAEALARFAAWQAKHEAPTISADPPAAPAPVVAAPSEPIVP